MKGNDLMKAMNGIDEKYLSESENAINNNRKNKKRAFKIAISVAAAAALAIPIGAYSYNTFVHRDNVEQYVSNAELIEQLCPEAVKNIVTENDDYRITVDTVLSDGNIVMAVLTHEPKTDMGLQIKSHVGGCPGTCITYADGSAGPFAPVDGEREIPLTFAEGYAVTDASDSVEFEKTVTLFRCKYIDDLSKDVKVEFFIDERGRSGALQYFNNRNDPDSEFVNELDGLEFTTSFAPNVKTVELHSAEGKTVSMSPFDVYSDDLSTVYIPDDPPSDQVILITNDGERKVLKSPNRCNSVDDGYIIYGEFIDIDAYKGVEINGVEYLK